MLYSDDDLFGIGIPPLGLGISRKHKKLFQEKKKEGKKMVGLIFTIIMGGIASIVVILNEHKKEIWDTIIFKEE